MSEKWHTLPHSTVLSKLKTSESGLSEEEASSRLSRFGPNELTERKGTGRLAIFFRQFTNFLVIILIIASLASIVIGRVTDSIVIIVIVILNAVLGFAQEYRAERAMEALKKLTTPRAIVLRDRKEKEIPAGKLVPGDIIFLHEGERIPADARLLEETVFKVDESTLTGESVPVTKHIPKLHDVQVSERKNMVFMGTIATRGKARAVVADTGMDTEIGKIAGMIQTADEKETPLQKRLKHFGKHLGLLILAISAIISIVGILKGGQPLNMLITGIALAVAAIPEGLPAVVTITLALGLQRMAKDNAIIRKLPAVETLGCTDVICSDKTGTLTRNEMTVVRLYLNQRFIAVTGKGYEPEGKFLSAGKTLNPEKEPDMSLLLRIGALCNDSVLEKDKEWYIIGDPTEGALTVAAAKAGFRKQDLLKEYPLVTELPFDPNRKMMSTIHKTMHGRVAYVKGAPEAILERCTHMHEFGKARPITPADRKRILETSTKMGDEALRVLAMAYRKASSHTTPDRVERDLVFVGLAGMIDPPRREVKHAIKMCEQAGIRVVMITGDHRNTAVAIARELNLLKDHEGRVLIGEELDKMSDDALRHIVEDISIYARVSPEHKMRIVSALKSKGHVVAVTGDGVNDAPALKMADIGVAMGIKGTDVAREASDMVLKDDNFASIVDAVAGGRRIYDNIKKFIQYLLSCNLGEVLVIFIAMLIGFTDPATGKFILPLLPAQILWINLITDGPPAVALGVDPPSPGIMKRKPRSMGESILSREMLTAIVLTGVVICIGTLLVFALTLPQGAGKAMTVAFTTLVVFELARVQMVRMKYKLGFFTNRKLVLAVASSLVLQLAVIYVPALQPLFGTVALSPADWLIVVAIPALLFAAVSIRQRLS